VIVIVAGVSGSGKSTIGALLAGRLGWPFTDGDMLHPEANVEKMERGEPLNDADRMPWLRAIAAHMDDWLAAGESGLIACSALKQRYRQMLLSGRPEARIAFLQIGRDVAARRLASRHGHFFDPDLLASQFADLELPGPGEARVVVVPVSDTAQETVDQIIHDLHLDRQAGVV
jgi:gluconokinase